MSRKVHKIRRRGHSVFNKRKEKVIKGVGYTFLTLLVLTLGFFSMKYMVENPGIKTETSLEDTASSEDENGSSDTAPTTETTVTAQQTANTSDSLKVIYLTVKQLSDTNTLDNTLDSASKAGFNAVLFDLKDEDGALHYASATTLAVQANSIADDAFTLDELKALIKQMQDKGFTAIPRLFAFKDPSAAYQLASAKITLESNHAYTWLDNSKEKGGKPWLNPYSTDAHKYIIDLASELSDLGFTAIMLDGVQFPNQTSQAYYGSSELTSLSKLEVLKKFVADLTEEVGDNCCVMQTMPGLATFDDGTEPFGGNPVTLGAATVSPVLMPSTLGTTLTVGETELSDPSSSPYEAVKLAAGQVKLRLELIDEDDQPDLMPWLQAYDYTDTQINQQIKAIVEVLGSDASYILYNSEGSYNFSSLE